MTVPAILFDCDGTLVDSQGQIVSCLVSVFESRGWPVPASAAIRSIIGLSLPAAIASLAPHAAEFDVRDAAIQYREVYTTLTHQSAEPLFPGIIRLLSDLEEKGCLLGVVTGKSRRGLMALLSAHGIENRFTTLQTADDGPSKPDPALLYQALSQLGAAVENAVMIGDTAFDMTMAVRAQVRAIGVGWGYHPPEELLAAGAVDVAESAEELGDIISRLGLAGVRGEAIP